MLLLQHKLHSSHQEVSHPLEAVPPITVTSSMLQVFFRLGHKWTEGLTQSLWSTCLLKTLKSGFPECTTLEKSQGICDDYGAEEAVAVPTLPVILLPQVPDAWVRKPSGWPPYQLPAALSVAEPRLSQKGCSSIPGPWRPWEINRLSPEVGVWNSILYYVLRT